MIPLQKVVPDPQAAIDQKDADLLNGLATVHMMFGLNDTALRFLELSDWIEPDKIETLRLMASSYFNLQHSKRVIQTLDKIQSLLPDGQLSEAELLQRGRSLALMGETDAARETLSSVYSDPKDRTKERSKT